MNSLVSVCLITYNHKQYIREAIDGVIMQRVNFTWNLVIADDFSNDGTREILMSYKNRFPDFIELILQNENVGPAKNFIDLITKPQSKYIAYLEGDDFWTDPYKLQKQFDFLESRNEIAGCFHDVKVVNENSELTEDNYYTPPKNVLNQQDCIVLGGLYCTGSLMFRTCVLKNLPSWFRKSPSDYAIDLLITEFGDIAHIEENMGAYRIHSGGTWQGNKMHKNLEDVVDRLFVCLSNSAFKKKYGTYFYKRISELSGNISLLFQKEGDWFKQIKYAWYYIYYSRSRSMSNYKFLIGTLLFPFLTRNK